MRNVLMIVMAWMLAATTALAQDITLEPGDRTSRQLVVVYFGATNCAPCLQDETKELVRKVIREADKQATQREIDFHSIGAGLDADWEEGIALLTSTAEFDEYTSGGGWTNSAAIEHLWKENTVSPAIPHIVIFTRSITHRRGGMDFANPIELIRLVGGSQMREWLRSGGVIF
jgi:hypothetical protein